MATRSEAVAAGMRAAQERGVKLGRPSKAPDPAALRVVRRQLAAGSSLAKIAEALNAKQIPTPSGTGQWTKPSVQNVVKWLRNHEDE